MSIDHYFYIPKEPLAAIYAHAQIDTGKTQPPTIKRDTEGEAMDLSATKGVKSLAS